MTLSPGDVVDKKYRVVRLIGEGGMGAVYEGQNSRINRRVAIKVLHASFAADPEITQRFERKAQAAGRIGNDHILEILDMGELPGGDHFMVMEYLEGETLGSRIRQKGRLTEREATDLVRQVLTGLAAAHQAQIVHRDLKPDNIFVLKQKANRNDFVKIIDFGISKFQALNQESGSRTRMGTLLGSPYYMSPEQASGNATGDRRSDLYSVGVILYEAITGKVPYEAQTLNQLMFKIVLADFVPPQTLVAELDPSFGSIVAKAMAKDADHRFQTAEQFIEALDGWLGAGTGVTIPPLESAGHLIQQAVGASSMVVSSALQTHHGVPAASKTSGGFSASQTSVPRKGQAAAAGALVVVMTLGLLGAGGALWHYGRSNTSPETETAKDTVTPKPAEQKPEPVRKAPTAPAPIVLPAEPSAVPAPTASAEEQPAVQEHKAQISAKTGAGRTPTKPSGSLPPPPKKKKGRDFGY